MEKYAKRLQDIINEQNFCFEPEEIRTVEKALGVLKKYEDADIPAEACVEYRKFEDELIRDGMSLQHVLDLLKAEREGRLKVRPGKPRPMLRPVPPLPQRAYESVRHLRGSQEQALPASWDAALLLSVEKSLP